MSELVLVRPRCNDKCRTMRLQEVLEYALRGRDYRLVERLEDFKGLQNQ